MFYASALTDCPAVASVASRPGFLFTPRGPSAAAEENTPGATSPGFLVLFARRDCGEQSLHKHFAYDTAISESAGRFVGPPPPVFFHRFPSGRKTLDDRVKIRLRVI